MTHLTLTRAGRQIENGSFSRRGMQKSRMRSRGLECGLVVLFLVFAFVGNSRAQESAEKQTPPPEAPSKKPAPDTKSVLMGASRASTAKAAEGAAKDKSQGAEADEAPKPDADSAVTELRPLPPSKQDQAADSKDGDKKKSSKRGPLKDVHGTVYGGSGSGSQAAGGSAGASTRSGKTSVYVEGQTGQARDRRR